MTPPPGKTRLGRFCAPPHRSGRRGRICNHRGAAAGASEANHNADHAGSWGRKPSSPSPRDIVFDMGEIVVVGSADGQPGVGGAVLTSEQIWTFDRKSLDQAVNIVPGVVSTFDANGRRNESDIFVRGFGRWQVPLMVDGVRIYLPADNRLDFSRFLTADIAEIQIQKGYASVLDGPGAMGGAINLVTRKPTKALEAEGEHLDRRPRRRRRVERLRRRSARASRGTTCRAASNYSDRDFWTLSGDYQPDGQLAAAERPAPQLRHVGFALQREGRLHAERHRRIHVELHQAARARRARR